MLEDFQHNQMKLHTYLQSLSILFLFLNLIFPSSIILATEKHFVSFNKF